MRAYPETQLSVYDEDVDLLGLLLDSSFWNGGGVVLGQGNCAWAMRAHLSFLVRQRVFARVPFVPVVLRRAVPESAGGLVLLECAAAELEQFRHPWWYSAAEALRFSTLPQTTRRIALADSSLHNLEDPAPHYARKILLRVTLEARQDSDLPLSNCVRCHGRLPPQLSGQVERL